MQTQPLYLNDSYLKEMNATVLDVKPEGTGWRLLLDQTVFYPMGGGQPTDQGTLSNTEWSGDVYIVMMKDGEIWHYVKAASEPKKGTVLKGVVNWDRRYKNMKVHSAGHIIDFALYLLKFSPQKLTPQKGDHGKKPYIMYHGTISEDVRQRLQDKSNELVLKNVRFTTVFQPYAELQKEALYLQPGLPTNKPLRTLRLEGVGAVADGGTQVAQSGEIGTITISTIETKEGSTIIHYSLASS